MKYLLRCFSGKAYRKWFVGLICEFSFSFGHFSLHVCWVHGCLLFFHPEEWVSHLGPGALRTKAASLPWRRACGASPGPGKLPSVGISYMLYLGLHLHNDLCFSLHSACLESLGDSPLVRLCDSSPSWGKRFGAEFFLSIQNHHEALLTEWKRWWVHWS